MAATDSISVTDENHFKTIFQFPIKDRSRIMGMIFAFVFIITGCFSNTFAEMNTTKIMKIVEKLDLAC